MLIFGNAVGIETLARLSLPGLLVSHRLCSLVKRRKTSGGTVLVNFVPCRYAKQDQKEEERGGTGEEKKRTHSFQCNSRNMVPLNLICQLIGSTPQSVTIRRSARYSYVPRYPT